MINNNCLYIISMVKFKYSDISVRRDKMQRILYVGIGGFVGASLRYIISMQSAKWFGTSLPYGTLIVNVIGGILMGFIMQLSLNSQAITPNLRLFITSGILGSLTVFSTFSYETISLFNEGSFALALLNTLLNVILSFLGVVIGKAFV